MALILLMVAWAIAGLGSCATCLEKATTLLEGWEKLAQQPDPSTPMRLSIAMRQPEAHGLTSKLITNTVLEVSQILSMRTPAEKDVKDVMDWLSDNGITKAKSDKDWIHVYTTIGEADNLLDMELSHYSFGGRRPVLRTTEYSIPDSLSEAIDFIHPIANFMTPKHEASRAPALEFGQALHRRDLACTPTTTPDCLAQLYGINYSTPDGKSSIRLGVAGFLEQWASYDDLEQQFERSLPDLAEKGYNFTVEFVNDGTNLQGPGKAGSEANLNMQFAMAISYPTKPIYYSIGGRGEKIGDDGQPVTSEYDDNEPYINFIQYLLDKSEDELPHVLSISYADDELSVPAPYAQKVCDMFGMLTGRGVSIIASSGDGGAKGARNATCRGNDGSNKEMTISTFPASCPWITAVGAVTNSQDPAQGASFSSGGFSNLFKRPDWQDRAVEEYVTELNGHLQGYYDPDMRAVPDISAVGTGFNTIINGSPFMLNGTGASTPVIAAMIALINDARVRKGKRVLGWLNKTLYSDEVRGVLQDITSGQSLSCVFSDGARPGGWPAKPGYDAITGLGVPNNFQKFMDVLVNA
jgi:tripeptidyl-peptidase-1